jgi:cyanophycinase-like exopeptidase
MQKPGPIVLFGSGETAASGRRVYEHILKKLPPAPKIALLETPAGFEPNASMVIERVASFLRLRLQNFSPQIVSIPARQRGTAYSPDDPAILEPLLHADMIFLGPGSPTYAVRQLKDSLAWEYILARHRLGAALVLASAAVIAVSTFSLPVYEIYKVGEDLHWKPGLDFFGLYGVPLVFIPHWNNSDGGQDLDTSRCFMGRERFSRLMDLLPKGLAVVGLDEKTSLLIEPGDSDCRVMGQGQVTILHAGHRHADDSVPAQSEQELDRVALKRNSHIHSYGNQEFIPPQECFPFKLPVDGEGIQVSVWQQALDAFQEPAHPSPSEQVKLLLEERKIARQNKDWAASDQLREQMAVLGWKVIDDRDGQRLEKI